MPSKIGLVTLSAAQRSRRTCIFARASQIYAIIPADRITISTGAQRSGEISI
jgi:hypothetical protein